MFSPKSNHSTPFEKKKEKKIHEMLLSRKHTINPQGGKKRATQDSTTVQNLIINLVKEAVSLYV